jgi:hypothetical protein
MLGVNAGPSVPRMSGAALGLLQRIRCQASIVCVVHNG